VYFSLRPTLFILFSIEGTLTVHWCCKHGGKNALLGHFDPSSLMAVDHIGWTPAHYAGMLRITVTLLADFFSWEQSSRCDKIIVCIGRGYDD
jgi:hypothetical protein